MHMSCQFKTPDGKRKAKGKKKPVAIRNAKARMKNLLKKLSQD